VSGLAGSALAKTMTEIAQEPNINALCNYQMDSGLTAHVEAGAAWLSNQGLSHANPDDVVITNGSQHGIMVALMTIAKPGDTILVDPLTYPGITHLAQTLGYHLVTVEGDEFGMAADALSEACRRHAPSVLYLMPSMQNPTSTYMSVDRRGEIAQVAKSYGLFVIEDDCWGPLIQSNAPHIANLIPDQTFFLASFAKTIAGGIRIGYILAPPRMRDKLKAAVRLTCWMPAPLMAEVARRWIYDGTAERLINWQRDQINERLTTFLKYMKNHPVNHIPGSLNLWLPLPEPWTAREFKARAEDAGVQVLPAEAFAVERHKSTYKIPQAVRIGIGRPQSLDDIITGATKIARLLDHTPEDNFNVL
jgi:DNA-binding transcriptional MocR family regulator